MKMMNGRLVPDKKDMLTSLDSRVSHAIRTFGPLTTVQLSRLAVGGSVGMRMGMILKACEELGLKNMNGKWVMNDVH